MVIEIIHRQSKYRTLEIGAEVEYTNLVVEGGGLLLPPLLLHHEGELNPDNAGLFIDVFLSLLLQEAPGRLLGNLELLLRTSQLTHGQQVTASVVTLEQGVRQGGGDRRQGVR